MIFFMFRSLVCFMDEFINKSDILMEKLRLPADCEKGIEMMDEFNNMTLEVIASVS